MSIISSIKSFIKAHFLRHIITGENWGLRSSRKSRFWWFAAVCGDLRYTHRLLVHSVGACTSSLCVCRKSPQTAAKHQNRDLREIRRPQFSPEKTCPKKKTLIL